MAGRTAKPPLERIARALCIAEGHPPDIRFEGRPMWHSYLPAADAALAAIGEPSAAMIDAAGSVGFDRDAARRCWSAMHLAAKKGPT